MRKNPQIFWTVIFLILGVLVWWFFASSGEGIVSRTVLDMGESGQKSEANSLAIAEGQTVTESGSDKVFTHSILGFNFSYEKDYNISSFGNYFDSAGQTILLQKDEGQGKIQQGLQVLITPFDEDISLTVARIKKDLPSLNITDAKEEKIGLGDKTKGSPFGELQAVVFSSTNNLSTGPTLEAWFISRGQLYQVSAPKESRDLFNKVISTWKLQE